MSVALLPALVFLAGILVVAEFVWLREGTEEMARSPRGGEEGSRLAHRPHSATFASRSVVGSKKSA